MLERFRKPQRTEAGASSMTVREREAARADAPHVDEPGTRARPLNEPVLDDDRREAPPEDRRFTRDEAVAEREPAVRRERQPPLFGRETMHDMRARQRERFGGIKWGSAFFGWLSALGLASILSALLVGAGVALGLSTGDVAGGETAQTIGLGGGIALLTVLAIAWFCGGYVAGRMARFDGFRQGIGVWAWTIVAAVAVALLVAVGGSQYDVFERLSLPRVAIGEQTLTTGGAITGAAALLVTLLAAVFGGKFGERFHCRVDRVATDDHVVQR